MIKVKCHARHLKSEKMYIINHKNLVLKVEVSMLLKTYYCSVGSLHKYIHTTSKRMYFEKMLVLEFFNYILFSSITQTLLKPHDKKNSMIISRGPSHLYGSSNNTIYESDIPATIFLANNRHKKCNHLG